jgi:hypothetical protein
MYDLGSARHHYGLAMTAAHKAGDPVLAAYMTGSLATFTAELGDGTESLALVAAARRQLGLGAPPIADAWLWAVAALAHAAAHDSRSTFAALDHCMTAIDRAPTGDAPPWPWVFAFSSAKVATYQLACAVRLGRPDLAFPAAAGSASLLAAPTKQAALWRLDHAEAHLQNDDVDAAFQIAAAVLDGPQARQSTRVIERARHLRRSFTNPRCPPAIRDFDERLRSLTV